MLWSTLLESCLPRDSWRCNETIDHTLNELGVVHPASALGIRELSCKMIEPTRFHRQPAVSDGTAGV